MTMGNSRLFEFFVINIKEKNIIKTLGRSDVRNPSFSNYEPVFTQRPFHCSHCSLCVPPNISFCKCGPETEINQILSSRLHNTQHNRPVIFYIDSRESMNECKRGVISYETERSRVVIDLLLFFCMVGCVVFFGKEIYR